MNRQQRRAQKRAGNKPRRYTEDDIAKKVKETAHIAAKFNLAQTLSCTLLVMHREYNWSPDQCMTLLEQINELALREFEAEHLTAAVREELGFDIIEEAKERMML